MTERVQRADPGTEEPLSILLLSVPVCTVKASAGSGEGRILKTADQQVCGRRQRRLSDVCAVRQMLGRGLGRESGGNADPHEGVIQ